MLTNIVTAVKKASINLNRDFSEIERLQNSVKGSMDFTKIAFDKIQKGLKNELGKILPALPVVMVSEKDVYKRQVPLCPEQKMSAYIRQRPKRRACRWFRRRNMPAARL